MTLNSMMIQRSRTDSYVMEDVYFSLGSNMGDRKGNLLTALEKMDAAFGTHYVRLSSFLETESWGFDADPFINCAVMYRLDADPEDVLDICKRIEREMGRKERIEYGTDGKRVYHSRIIDIDILYFGNRSIDTPRLTVPHPLIGERDFVKIPLAEIMEVFS